MATLMLVDDEPSILEVYKNVLEIKNHTVICEARDGEAAVVLYGSLKEKPDVILMDHRMPKSNGITAMRNIHFINPLQCIIFVTADFEAAKQVMNFGANGFILKPFRMDTLFNSIQVAISDIRLRENRIRESFLGLVANLRPEDPMSLKEISEKLEREVIDTFIPGDNSVTLTIETMANWLCKFFNLMGLNYTYQVSGNQVVLKNSICIWGDSLGSNPKFCTASKCVISRFAMKTCKEFTLDCIGTIMGGHPQCEYILIFS
ncbi:MAG TPA: hypothetical protein DCY35_00960 [Prolixibacteraceae bacterium]|nr:hypothetical protein [Prolixibacteraceae bacterium]